jgi:catechol 2,3-dioxygenase-like lactoylglutathione lyase family enzyme
MHCSTLGFLFACALAALGPARLSAQENGHFHHLHMDVSDIEETVAFYQETFGVVAIDYAGHAPALMADRGFLLMEEMPRGEIRNHQLTGLTHAGWGSFDAVMEYARLRDRGVEFYTPLTPLSPETHYMYLYGPDHEVIEIFDPAPHHNMNHVHQMALDPEAALQWYKDNVNPVLENEVRGETANALFFDTLLFSLEVVGGQFTPRENTGALEPTDGSHLDHLAFAFDDLDAAYERMRRLGTVIDTPITVDEKYGFRYFFTHVPNGVRVEFVEAPSWPDAAWD